MNRELYGVRNWILSNKFTLNLDKTHNMTFHRNKKIPKKLKPIKVDNIILKEEEKRQLLGRMVY